MVVRIIRISRYSISQTVPGQNKLLIQDRSSQPSETRKSSMRRVVSR